MYRDEHSTKDSKRMGQRVNSSLAIGFFFFRFIFSYGYALCVCMVSVCKPWRSAVGSGFPLELEL